MDELELTQDRLASLSGCSQTTIYKLCSGKAKESRKLLAIADALRVSPRWLATGKGDREVKSAFGLADVKKQVAVVEDPGLVAIPQFDAGGRMGNGGLVLQDQPGMIRRWEVTRDWLNQNVKGVTGISNLCIVTGFGDSMKPMFNPGDPLLIDQSVKTVEYDAVYFFRVDGEGFIKRIQRIPGRGLVAISANRDHYEPWTITPDMDFEVLGRVLKVWRGDDF
jgi:phage repressor protein C with HTH and peptisase S24 domain